MDLSDLEPLLQPLSPDEPCGPDLEYDPEFGEMDRATQGKAEQQFGDTVVDAEPPNWKQASKHAEKLLGRTKDMRVVAQIARASLHLEGFVAFEQAMHLLRCYVETFWETVHPQLDADDNNDPTFRTNTLLTLCDESEVLREIRDCPIVSSRAVGKFSFNDYERASDAADSDGDGPSLAAVEAAFTDAEIEQIQATEAATRLTAEHFDQIESFVTDQVGTSLAVSLSPATDLLKEINAVLVQQLERRGVFADEPVDPEAEADDQAGETAAEGGQGPVPDAQGGYVGGKIMNRVQAIKAMDDVCDYYERCEPSSPLPLLIRRAQRLASKSFIDILRDLAPEAVSNAEALSGGGGDVGGQPDEGGA